MSKTNKLKSRLLSRPADFTWDELVKLLSGMGYAELPTGKTGGSRRKFADHNNHIISLHKPHPGNIIKKYMLTQIINALKEKGKIINE